MKRIKAMNGYTIYQLTQRDVNNEFYNATIGNYVIYLSSDIRDYGRSGCSPEYEDIETLEECIEICDGVTAIAQMIVDYSDSDNSLENIERIENVLTVARNNNYFIGIEYTDSFDKSIICVSYDGLLSVLSDIHDNDDEIITGISLRDSNGNIINTETATDLSGNSEYDIYKDMMHEIPEIENTIREHLTTNGCTVYGVFLAVAVENERLYFCDIEYSKSGNYNRIYRRMSKKELLKFFHING